MAPNDSTWHRLATLGTILGVLLLLADLAILGRYVRFMGVLVSHGAGYGPALGG